MSVALRAYVLLLIRAEARRSRNADALARFEDRDDGYRARAGETAAEVRTMRANREAHLTGEA